MVDPIKSGLLPKRTPKFRDILFTKRKSHIQEDANLRKEGGYGQCSGLVFGKCPLSIVSAVILLNNVV